MLKPTFFKLDDFIAKFERLTDEQFCSGGLLHRGRNRRLQADAYGHCLTSPGEARALRSLFGWAGIDLAELNDGAPGDTDTPRERVLTLLRDMKAFKVAGISIPVWR